MKLITQCVLGCLLLGVIQCGFASDAPDQAKSLIIFYRPKRFTGSGLKPSVYVDGKQLARLENGRYFAVSIDPGQHEITSSMKHAPLEVTPKPGEAIYLEMVILMGTWRGGGRFIPTPADDAQSAIKQLKPLDQKWVTDQRVNFDFKTEPTSAAEHVERVSTTAAAPGAAPASAPAPTPGAALVPANAPAPAIRNAVVHVKSEPSGADVELDGKFVGNTPTTLRLVPGDYGITIRKNGRREWQRKITALADNEMEVSAELEPTN